MKLSATQTDILVQIGLDTLLRANAIITMGHTSIEGHCYYLTKTPVTLIDNLLFHLRNEWDRSDEINKILTRPDVSQLMMNVLFEEISR